MKITSLILLAVISPPILSAQSSPSPEEWAEKGSQIWTYIQSGKSLQHAETVGWVDFQHSKASVKMEVDAQMFPEFTTAEGERIKPGLRDMNDPVHGTNVMQSGGQFLDHPAPFDHDDDGNPLGLKVNTPANKNAAVYNRLGIRLENTPPGKLLFLYEMTSEDKPGSRWYAREVIFPVAGCPWRPESIAMNEPARESHLLKLAVFVLEPWENPAERIPEKLHREDLVIDFDAHAADLDWPGTMDWIVKNISDDSIAPGETFIIQLPGKRLEDTQKFGVILNKYSPLGKTLNALTGGRKVWLVGHPDTTMPCLATHDIHNVGVLFTRIGRREQDGVTADNADRYNSLVSVFAGNFDFRNNWLECPDGTSGASITLVRVENCTFVDNILGGGAAGFSTGGNSQVVSTVIARNWMERAYDAVQMYGGWQDVVFAYNHFAGASGYANRQHLSGHLGANLHTDEFQSQANSSSIHPQQFWVFSNLSQFGKHNWPAQWAPVGGGTQNFIIDSDAYVNTHIYWNIFQNLQPTGHRGIKTISPDIGWVQSNPEQNQKDYIQNLSIVGNAFLERWDFNNHPLYGYWRPESSIGGRLHQPFFELMNSENLYATTHLDRIPALFKNVMESRPDPEVMVDWRKHTPKLQNVYQRPITFTGSVKDGYLADFSKTTYAEDKFLEGFLAPTDFSVIPEWEKSPSGAARLTPRSELSQIAPMPTDLAAFLGDPSRAGSFFNELNASPVKAAPQILQNPWRAEAKDDGFVLHIKFGSVGTPGTEREIFRETAGDRSYRVLLTRENTARYEMREGKKLLSQVEGTDTFKDGDHLSMQVYTPYFPIHPEGHYPSTLLSHAYANGIRKIRYISSKTEPAVPATEADTLSVWMNPEARYQFKEWKENQWLPVWGGRDTIHANAIRSFSANRKKFFSGRIAGGGIGTAENYRRDLYPVPEEKWMNLYLDGPGEDSTGIWQDNDLRWVNTGTTFPIVFLKQGESVLGGNAFFSGMAPASGRPRCVIRHNIDHQDKKHDWIWTPDETLPRGEVTLFKTFDGSYESFRVIRGGQGEYGLPKNEPAYRWLESITAALAFIRPPLDKQGKVPGWGTPEIYLKGE